MRTIIAASLLIISACDPQVDAGWDQSWETSPRPVDYQQPPGAQALTLTGDTAVETGSTYTWTVSGADLVAGTQVTLAWGRTQGPGRCPRTAITGGTPCMDITGPARPLLTSTAVADPLTPGQAIATFDFTVPPTGFSTVYLQALALFPGDSSTTDVLSVGITPAGVNEPLNSKYAHPATEASIMAESVVCLTEGSGGLWAVGMDTGGMAQVTLGGDFDFDLTNGLGTVFGQPAALNYELARRGDEVWFIDAFTGVDVYADVAAFTAGTVSQHFNRPGTSSRITIEGNQGYATWHSTDEINWFDTTTGALTNTVTMADWDAWVQGLSSLNGSVYLMNQGDGTYSDRGRRIGVMDPSTGVDSCNVFLRTGWADPPYDSSLPLSYAGLYCFTPPAP